MSCPALPTLPGADGSLHFAARFYAAPVPGQIGPQDRLAIIYAASLTAAKRVAKAVQVELGCVRTVEVFPIEPSERAEFRRRGWYANEARDNAPRRAGKGAGRGVGAA